MNNKPDPYEWDHRPRGKANSEIVAEQTALAFGCRMTWRIQPVVATPRRGTEYNCSASTSAGVLHPSVFRGRSLSAAATARTSRMSYRAKSVPFGKYCRSSPLVFSFVPRCHGLYGSQKYTLIPVAAVSSAWRASSLPRSQVTDLRRCSGSGVIAAARASRTDSDPYPDRAGPFFTGGASPYPSLRGRCSSVVNLLVRSTSVPTADRLSPMM